MGWLSDVYLVCAVVGGTLLVLQTILVAVGGHHDGDVSGDGDVSHGSIEGHPTEPSHDAGFFKWLSLKTVVACLTFFGLGGLAADQAGLAPWGGLAIAILSGSAAIVLVAGLMALMARLQSAGNLDLQNAVGTVAKVYLRVPAARVGSGKVTLEVQGRYVEAEAVTAGPEIPTGASVRVVGVAGPLTLEVATL
jgi:hypothetical protein